MRALEVDTSTVRVSILNQADKSDPLNQFLSVVVSFGPLSFKVTVDNWNYPKAAEMAIAALFLAAVENAAGIRDAIVPLKATEQNKPRYPLARP
jgi:hypothetical protein